jgi:lipopolysaccharide export system protein LptA
MRNFFAIWLALGAGGLLCAQAQAQIGASDSPALAGTSTNGETIIFSDNGFESHYKLKTIVYRVNVRAYNPQMNLRCELMTVESPEVEDGKFNRVTAETNVVIDWVDERGTNHATSDKAVYTYVVTNLAKLPEMQYQTNSTVVLTGSPHVRFGQDTVDGDPIIWDRIKDIISTPKLQKTTIVGATNIFEGSLSPKADAAPKTNAVPKTNSIPK